MSVSLSNSGSAALSISAISATGSFAQSNNCGFNLAPNTSCTISVTFTPTTTGNLSGTLSVTDNASGSPQCLTLYGTGVTAGNLVASPSSVAFGNVTAGQTSSQSVTVTNNGGSPVTINSVSLSGSGVEFSGLSTPLTLAANASTSFTVTFAPGGAGSVSGGVYLTNTSPTANFEVPVTGSGVTASSASVSPSSLSFGSESLNTTSSAQGVTLTNNGTAALSISSISTSGSFAESNNCGSSLAAGSSCSISVTFTPTASGSASGTLTVTDNAAGGTQTVALTGSGAAHEVLLSWDADSAPVSGYNTYRSTVSGGPYSKLTSSPLAATSYTDFAVQSGATYYYVVTAVGTNSVESGYSNEAEAQVP